jgi:predicted aspartyl protease
LRIIEGYNGDGDLTFVTAYLICRRPRIEVPIRLYVDTGASRTIVNTLDAEKIGINYSRLDKSPYQLTGMGGSLDAYFLYDCTLIFGENEIIEDLDHILVAKPPQNAIAYLSSLLGLDVLRKYRISFTDEKVILERREDDVL